MGGVKDECGGDNSEWRGVKKVSGGNKIVVSMKKQKVQGGNKWKVRVTKKKRGCKKRMIKTIGVLEGKGETKAKRE